MTTVVEKKVNFNVRLPAPLKEDLKAYADECKITLEDLAKLVFKHLLEERPTIHTEPKFDKSIF